MSASLPKLSPAVITAERRMAKASLRKAQNDDWIVMGRIVERTRQLAGLSLKEFAAQVNRNPRQVAAWIEGREQPQAAVIYGVKTLRGYFLIAQAQDAGDGVELETVLRVRRA